MYSLGQLWLLNYTIYDDRYLLDVNPNSKLRTFRDNINVIDARFIDTYTGYYMDITALANQSIGYSLETTHILSCKSPHWYSYEDIFPLRATIFNDVAVWRPNNPMSILMQEYTEGSMFNLEWTGWKFTDQNVWVKG